MSHVILTTEGDQILLNFVAVLFTPQNLAVQMRRLVEKIVLDGAYLCLPPQLPKICDGPEALMSTIVLNKCFLHFNLGG